MRKLAVAGFGLVAAMQLYFFVTGNDRAAPYREIQLVSFAATLAAAYGIASGANVALAVGLGVNLVTRILQPVLGLTRLPVWATLILSAGWAIACVQAARGRSPALGVWILAFGHALSMLTVFARMGAAVALGVGAIGLFLAAPNVRPHAAEAASRDVTPRR